jgi:hypothetical protein
MSWFKPSKTIWWWEPRWSHCASVRSEWRELVQLDLWMRVIAVSALATGAIAGVVEVFLRPQLPALQFDWFAALLKSISAIAACLAVHVVLRLAIPSTVSLRPKGISIQWGESVRWFPNEKIISVHLVLRERRRHYLRIVTERGMTRVGIGWRVNLDQVAEFLAGKLVVHTQHSCGTTSTTSARLDATKC